MKDGRPVELDRDLLRDIDWLLDLEWLLLLLLLLPLLSYDFLLLPPRWRDLARDPDRDRDLDVEYEDALLLRLLFLELDLDLDSDIDERLLEYPLRPLSRELRSPSPSSPFPLRFSNIFSQNVLLQP